VNRETDASSVPKKAKNKVKTAQTREKSGTGGKFGFALSSVFKTMRLPLPLPPLHKFRV